MKRHKPVKHAHRKAMISEKKAKGRYSKPHTPHPDVCYFWHYDFNHKYRYNGIHCGICVVKFHCTHPYQRSVYFSKKYH